MEKLYSKKLIASEHGEIHLVSVKGISSLPSWLVHTQIELDGNRVFVRWIDTNLDAEQNASGDIIGIVVSPVY